MEYQKLNSYQTPLTEELKDSLPKEVWDDMMEFIATVDFIRFLIAPEEVRGYAKDKPRHNELEENDERRQYDDDRIVVNLVEPHILEDMDFFRERALFFQENKRYTNITPNPSPKSEYTQFWEEEVYRWKYGLKRESDGEWIPGALYFYWNYSPIYLVEINPTTGKGERIREFPKPWLGDYLFYHYIEQAQIRHLHGKLLKCRGIGFSFKSGAMSPRNMYIYEGTGNPNFHLASDKTFLTGDKGVYGKVMDTLDWIAENTPLPRMRLQDGKKEMVIQLGFTDEYGVRKGQLTSVTGISLKDNPDKARGIRGPFIQYEEDGLFKNLEKAWNVNLKAVEDGGIASGFMLAGGTGGTEGANFEGSEKLFYKHDAYNIYGIPNVFDRNMHGENTCGFFWGAYMNRNGCYDETTGEPDVIKALVEILKTRFKIKYSSTDSLAITQKKAEECITPQEAVMRTEGTVFPVADLKEYLESLMPIRDQFLSEHYVGELVLDNMGDVTWKPNADLHPLRSYDAAMGNRTGAVEIFEMPKKDNFGQIIYGRYIAGIDPIDSDTGPSLFSIMVMDTFTDRIVAEYTGRPNLANDAYETALRLLKFYNAQANYESNLKGIFSYFDQKNALHYLVETPQILRDMELVKSVGYGNQAKGTRATIHINKWGRDLQAEWMKSKYNPEDPEDHRLNLHRLRSLAYIEEAVYWNADGNFDRISSGGMLFVLRADRHKRIQYEKEHQFDKVKQLSDDPYWSKNYTDIKSDYNKWNDKLNGDYITSNTK